MKITFYMNLYFKGSVHLLQKQYRSVKKKISSFLLLLFFAVTYTPSFSQGHPATDDEFVGPFSSWLNVKTGYGAVGDGVADETAALQAALDAVGNSSSTASVVYLPPGTYRITGTLTVSFKMNVSLIGGDPSTTKIIWNGAAGGTMLKLNGVAYSRFNRITFDGASVAGIAVDQSWDASQAYFDTGNEYADNEFINTAIGIRGGHLGYGFAETAILRCKFTNNTMAGITLGNFNALDVWVWHSIFENCAVGITNNNTTGSAGNFKVYNSIFRGSTTSDIVIGNTGEFAFRDNTSTNSQMFLKTTLKTYPAHITLQSNTIIDPVASKAIEIQNQGPVFLLDNIIRSRPGATSPVVSHTPFPSGDFFSMGNTFTVANAIQATSKKITYDNAVVTAASLSGLTEQSLPGVQPNLNRTILEIPAGATTAAIQSIIDQAALLTGTRPVVHFKHGSYDISSTLSFPSGSDMQIIGDGHGDVYTTWLNWTGGSSGPVININGPSKVTFRDISINGNNLVSNIVMSNIDQAGSRVFMNGLEANMNSNGLLVNGLDYTVVLAYNSRISQVTGKAVNVIGGPLASTGFAQSGKTIIYGGLEWGNSLSHEVTNGGNLLVRDVWYESGSNGPYLYMTGKGNFTVDCSSVASPRATVLPQCTISGLSGKASFINSYFQDRIAISGNGANTKVLGLGTVFGDNTLPVTGSSTTYFENTSSPAAAVESFNSRADNDPNLVTPRSGSYAVNDIGTPDSANIANMLQTLRGEHAKVLTSLASGITDVRFYRVWLYKGTTAIELQGNGVALPVKFVSVNSVCNDGNIKLSWVVQDNSMKKFDIERNDNGTWIVINSITSSGGSDLVKNYNYDDKTGKTNSVYRIAAYDINGFRFTSKIVYPSCSIVNNFRIYPNPAKKLSTLSVIAETSTIMDVIIFDNKGMAVKKFSTLLARGINNIDLDLTGLASGAYLVKAKWNNTEKTIKLLKSE